MTERAHPFDIAVIAVCLFLAVLTMALNWSSPIAMSLQRGERITGLLLGSDYEDYTRHSDTMMFVSYDPTSRFLDVMSIPRDTMVSLPDMPNVHRINEIFAYDWRHSHDFSISSLHLKSEIETLLSSGAVHPVRIPYFFAIDYNGFRSLIDAMGGVYVRVTESMNYDDNWGHLHIHFQPGTYLLDGKRALEYVRFRGTSADQGRVLRQQLFVKDVLKRLKNPMLLWRFPEYSKLLVSGFHTNVSLWDLATILLEGRRMKWRNLRLFSLPGAPSGNYWKMNPENTQHIVSMMLEQAPRKLQESERAPHRASASEMRITGTVEVWNASSRPNAAKAVMQMIRANGFDVVLFGNFSTRQQRTLVIDRSGKLRPAQAVAEILRSVNPEVVSRVDASRQVDVSVIIGNDFEVPESDSL